MSLGALVWVFGCGTFSYTLWGATDPLLWLPQCLLRCEITTLQGSVLYLFNCKCPRLSWMPWVGLLQLLASLLGGSPPSIPQTPYWSGKDHNLSEWIGACRISCNFGEPTNLCSIPVKVTHTHIYEVYRPLIMLEYPWFSGRFINTIVQEGTLCC